MTLEMRTTCEKMWTQPFARQSGIHLQLRVHVLPVVQCCDAAFVSELRLGVTSASAPQRIAEALILRKRCGATKSSWQEDLDRLSDRHGFSAPKTHACARHRDARFSAR